MNFSGKYGSSPRISALSARIADSVLAADLLTIAREQLTAGVGVALDVTRAQSQLAGSRAQLIAAGAHVAAPCPHDAECPLTAPDWCHFSQRLPRSRAHQQIKRAELPFEDEKFSYVALTRAPVAHRASRVLAQPDVTKFEVSAKLCTVEGLAITKVPRRAKPDYASARRWQWGDAVTETRSGHDSPRS